MKQFLLFSYLLLFAVISKGNNNLPDTSEEMTSKNSLVENVVSFSTTESETSLPNSLPYGPDAFVTRWKTYISETPVNDRITIPTVEEESYNYNVDWGDGSIDNGVTGDITHIYDSPGSYTVSITGTFPRIKFKSINRNRLLKVLQWGTGQWSSMEEAFAGCKNLDLIATDVPDLTDVSSLVGMFSNCTVFKGNASFANWDVANVENMDDMFNGLTLSKAVYEALLEGWSSRTSLRNGVLFDGGTSQYCEAEPARQKLIDDFGWSITDGGKTATCGPVQAGVPFITRWKTYIPETPVNDRITIPTVEGEIYNYSVDWGDGKTDGSVTGDITHVYDRPGSYTVSITGTFPGIRFKSINRNRLLKVQQWGDITWKTMEGAFLRCTNLDVTATDVPDLSQVTTLVKMFSICTAMVGNDSFNNWDVSNVISMEEMFSNATSFDQDLGRWNVANVTNTQNMFHQAFSFNQDLGNWDVGKLTNSAWMFSDATAFNGEIGSWDVSSIQDFTHMFNGASSFNRDIGNWDVSGGRWMRGMFVEAASFNQDIGNWDVSNAESMQGMFERANDFDQDLGRWDVGKVVNMRGMFNGPTLSTENYDKLLVGWSSLPSLQPNVNFDGGESLYCNGQNARQNIIDTYGWNITDGGLDPEGCEGVRPFVTKWVTNPQPYFSADYRKIELRTDSELIYNYLVDWGDGSSDFGVTGGISHTYAVPGSYEVSISGEFPAIRANTQLTEIKQWGDIVWQTMKESFLYCIFMDVTATDVPDLSAVTDTSFMFEECRSLRGNSSFNNWDVSNVSNMKGMFSKSTFGQDIGNWDVGNVTNMSSMFVSAMSFNSDLSNWDVSQVTDMSNMFWFADSFNQNFGNWNVGNVVNMEGMFEGSGHTVGNYDSLLQGWADLPSLQSGVNFDAGFSYYCEAAEARQHIIDTYGWTIKDLGKWEDCSDENSFVTTWKTDNNGTTANNQIRIPTVSGLTYNYTVDWGDGASDSGVTGDITHTYPGIDTYQVSITGDFPAIRMEGSGEEQKLIRIEHWGDIVWQTMEKAFSGCANLDITAVDIPDLSNVTNLSRMFTDCSSLVLNTSINDWDTGNITSMSRMFEKAEIFNQPIGNWNTGNVTRMDYMLHRAYEFNQPIGDWDVSKVQKMYFMLAHQRNFDQDLSNWDTGAVDNMFGLFYKNPKFNSNIANWNTAKVTNMEAMFLFASAFNQPIGSWDVSNVTNMGRMFWGSGFDQDLGNWNVGKAITMQDMFTGLTLSTANYDAILEGWNGLPSLKTGVALGAGGSFFCSATAARQNLIDTYGWTITDGGRDDDACEEERPFVTTWRTQDDNTVTIPVLRDFLTYNFNVAWGDGTSDSGVTGTITHTYAAPGDYSVSISGIFPSFSLEPEPILYYVHEYSPKLRSVDQWGTIKWKTMAYAFAGCYNMEVKATDVPDLSQTTVMSLMFANCTSMVGNDSFNNWDTSNITTMEMMFSGASKFNAPIGNWDVSKVAGMRSMFVKATAFNQDIGNWDVGQVGNMGEMFNAASSFAHDIGNWDTNKVTFMVGMFKEASAFNKNIGNWDVSGVEYMNEMFMDAASFDQDLGNWDVSNVISMEGMLQGLSIENYDKTLLGWNELPSLKNGVIFSAGSSQYCSAVIARQHIIDTYSWIILDGGENCSNLAKNDNDSKGNDIESELPTLSFGADSETSLSNRSFDMTLYPNPSTDVANISFYQNERIVQFQLFDMAGRLVKSYNGSETKNGNGYQIDIRAFETGSYFLWAHDVMGNTHQEQLLIVH